MLEDRLKNALTKAGGYKPAGRLPAYLRRYRWVPTFALRHIGSGTVVAFELVETSVLPRHVLLAAEKAIADHPDLGVVVLCHIDAASDEVVRYCKERTFGLWVFSGDAVSSLVQAPFEATAPPVAAQAGNEGWVPQAICQQAADLRKVRAARVIRGSLDVLSDPRTSDRHAMAAVETAVGELIADQRSRFAAEQPFYQFAVIERLLRMSDPGARDHVIHSYRVYVTGCVLLEHFWDCCKGAYRQLCRPRASIEDMWFLTAMFHDCGYTRLPAFRAAAARAFEVALPESETEDEVIPKGDLDYYRRAARLVGSLLHHLLQRTASEWDFDAVGWSQGSGIQEALLRWYQRRQSHAVASALDLAAAMIKRVQSSAGGRGSHAARNRLFLGSHVYPAAAAIALHDHHLWDEFKPYGLIPFPAERHPLAGMLIYLDTWDEYRRGASGDMIVSALHLSDSTATVSIGWPSLESQAAARIAYANYKRSVRWPKHMRLVVRLASDFEG